MNGTATQRFDAIIVGAGQAGPPLADRLTDAGQKVAVIERKLVGGTCVNYGCIPTKTLVASAHAAHLARRSAEYGVRTGEVSVDMAKVKAHKDKIVLGDRDGVESWLNGMDGCTFIRGHARFVAEVRKSGRKALIGKRPMTGVDAKKPYTAISRTMHIHPTVSELGLRFCRR